VKQTGKHSELKSKKTYRLNILLRTAEEIEEAITQFNKVIQNAAWGLTQDDKPQPKYPEYPREIKDQIKKKRKLRRWQMSRSSEEKRRYNEATSKLKDYIKNHTRSISDIPSKLKNGS
jgi:thiamine kinase-like enzyme